MDRRIEKTKKSIKKAFAYLLSQKEINEITITDIANIADINRKTFYSYYGGIYGVVDEIEDEIVDIFNKTTKNLTMNDFLENPNKVLHQLNEIVHQDLDYYGNLIRIKGNSNLSSKIIELIKTRIETDFIKEYPKKDPAKVSVIVDFIVSGIVETFRIWFNTDRKIPMDELSLIIEKFIFTGINGILK